MESLILLFKVDRCNLHLFRFLLESADHLASVTVVKGKEKEGLVEVSLHPRNKDLLMEFLDKINLMFEVKLIYTNRS